MYISNFQISVGVLNSVASQLDGFYDDLCGPFQHGVDVDCIGAINLPVDLEL